jgi:hypothetical protein
MDWQPIIARIGQVRRLEERSVMSRLTSSDVVKSGTILIRRFRLKDLDRDQNGIRASNR